MQTTDALKMHNVYASVASFQQAEEGMPKSRECTNVCEAEPEEPYY